MSKEMWVIVLGVWVVVVPYLGIPSPWRTALLVLTGIAVAIIGFLLRGEALSHQPGQGGGRTDSHSFVESKTDSTPRHDSPPGINSFN